jgi:hypothetical protein
VPITVGHAKSVTVADGGDTTVVRPSDWNSSHVVTFTPAATELSSLFDSVAPTNESQAKVWFGTSAGSIVASAQVNGAGLGVLFNNRSSLGASVVAAASGVGIRVWSLNPDVFAADGGVTFGSDTNSKITASCPCSVPSPPILHMTGFGPPGVYTAQNFISANTSTMATWTLMPQTLGTTMAVSAACAIVGWSGASSTAAATHRGSIALGLYSKNASTYVSVWSTSLDLSRQVSSSSQSYSLVGNGGTYTASTVSANFIRDLRMTVPFATTLSAGTYLYAAACQGTLVGLSLRLGAISDAGSAALGWPIGSTNTAAQPNPFGASTVSRPWSSFGTSLSTNAPGTLGGFNNVPIGYFR